MGRGLALVALVGAWAALLVMVAPLVLAGRGSSGPATPGSGARVRGPVAVQTPQAAHRGTRREFPAAQPSAVARPGEISITWAGDITLGSRYGNPPEHGRALFADVRDSLASSDLALGNLEGTLSAGGASKCGSDGGQCFSFQAPPENASALRWAGFDVMSLANNHAYDFGPAGQRQTITALSSHTVAHTGRPGQITLLRRRGIRIATLGFAPYRWSNDLRNLAAVTDMVRRAAAQAQIVVVLAHLGAEGSAQTHVPPGPEIALGEDRGNTRAFAHAAIEAGADLVLGSGPHVLRGIETHNGKLIAYSLGNFAGWHNFSTTGNLALSGLLTIRLSAQGQLRGGKFAALRLSGPGAPAQDPTRQSTALINQLGAQDFGKASLRLLPDGTF